MMAIESAKREIVARAYLDQVIGTLAKPTEDDARKYYAETPALFANRKIYRIQELTVGNDTSVLAQMKQMVAAGRSLDDMAAWLKSHQVQFGNTGTTRPAEQIPLDILPKLAELREGQIAVFEGPQNFIVVRLLGSQPAAISESEARPRILQFLHNRNAQKAIEAELQKMKAAAKIEFQGEFASTAKPVAGAPAADLAKPAVPNAEKGVAGLK